MGGHLSRVEITCREEDEDEAWEVCQFVFCCGDGFCYGMEWGLMLFGWGAGVVVEQSLSHVCPFPPLVLYLAVTFGPRPLKNAFKHVIRNT
jgi:hypothetical protein